MTMSGVPELAGAYQAIGAYVCAYSDAAYELGETLKVLFRLKENEMADAIVAALGDFARQASLVAAICESARDASGAELSKEQKQRIEQTIKELFSCNDDRVKISHARLQANPDGSADLVRARVIGGKLKRDSEKWSQAELVKKTEKLKKLAEHLRAFQKELQTITISKGLPEGWLGAAINAFQPRPMSAALMDVLTQPTWVPRPPDKPAEE